MWRFLKKLKVELLYGSVIAPPKEYKNTHLKGDMQPYVHSSIISQSQTAEGTKMPTSRRTSGGDGGGQFVGAPRRNQPSNTLTSDWQAPQELCPTGGSSRKPICHQVRT